jgi:hypothetical protein
MKRPEPLSLRPSACAVTAKRPLTISCDAGAVAGGTLAQPVRAAAIVSASAADDQGARDVGDGSADDSDRDRELERDRNRASEQNSASCVCMSSARGRAAASRNARRGTAQITA